MEQQALPSELEVMAKLRKILSTNWKVLTLSSVMELLQADFETPISSIEAFVNREISKYIRTLEGRKVLRPPVVMVCAQDREHKYAALYHEADERARKRHHEDKVRAPEYNMASMSSGVRMAVSPPLAEFMQVTAGTKLNPQAVFKYLTKYIKERDLQDKRDPQITKCDRALRKLLGTERITFFNLHKSLSAHFHDSSKSKHSSRSRKRKKKSGAGSTAPPSTTGFNAPLDLSPALSAVVDGHTQLSRPIVLKLIWAYIRRENLQNPTDRRVIMCDDKLKEVFQADSVDMMMMNKVLSSHLSKPKKPITTSSTAAPTSTLNAAPQKKSATKPRSSKSKFPKPPAAASSEQPSEQASILSAGCRVAALVPVVNGPNTWILATVEDYREVNADQVYSVVDVDVAPGGAGNDGRFEVKRRDLLALVPSSRIFAVGQRVLALYPDSTSFYPCAVRAVPASPENVYSVCFDDDNESLRPVPPSYVLDLPAST